MRNVARHLARNGRRIADRARQHVADGISERRDIGMTAGEALRAALRRTLSECAEDINHGRFAQPRTSCVNRRWSSDSLHQHE
jgi:hypothetical protein